ncbi:MAG: NAD(+)/NADH kinase [Planctomycetota bacterium]
MARKQTSAPQTRGVRRVLVVADLEKEGVREFRQRLMDWLASRVDRVELEGDLRAFLRRREAEGFEIEGGERPDLVVVLGGDGAILAAVRAFAKAPVPTLGINFGRVGFLASTPVGDWEEVLSGVLDGRGVLEPRMRLNARMRTHDGDEIQAVALNDVVLLRGVTQGMLTVALRVDGEWVTDYRADGLIVATPSGSTAHSLSAGGPILIPSMFGLVVTPICPQGLAHRPLVLNSDSKIELGISSSGGLTTLVVDGQGYAPMRQGDTVYIERHPIAYPLLGSAKLDPYRRLRERLGWSGAVAPLPSKVPGEPRGIGPALDAPHDDRGL